MRALHLLRKRVATVLRRDDSGAAIVEFVLLAVVVFVPLTYGVAAFSAVQRGIFASTEAAREAGRLLGTAADLETGLAQARYAAELAVTDQGLDPADLSIGLGPEGDDCSTGGSGYTPTFEIGERFTVCVTVVVRVPFLDFIDSNTSTGVFVVDRDDFRER